jgi:hypothetical protein
MTQGIRVHARVVQVLAALVVMVVSGCAPPKVFTPRPEPPKYLEAPRTPLVLVALSLPKVQVNVVGYRHEITRLGEQALAAEEARFRSFVAAFVGRMSGKGVRVLPETDAGDGPMPPGTVLLRVDVTDLPTVTDARLGPANACFGFGAILLVTLPACATIRNHITQEAHVSLRLYDVSGLTTERIQKGGELVRVLDTSGLQPEVRHQYTAVVESGRHATRAPRGQDAIAFAEQQGERLGELTFEAIADPLTGTLNHIAARASAAAAAAAAAAAPPPAPSTSGGEVPAEPAPTAPAPAPSGGESPAQPPPADPAPPTAPAPPSAEPPTAAPPAS